MGKRASNSSQQGIHLTRIRVGFRIGFPLSPPHCATFPQHWYTQTWSRGTPGKSACSSHIISTINRFWHFPKELEHHQLTNPPGYSVNDGIVFSLKYTLVNQWLLCICYAQSADSHYPRIFLHKPLISALHSKSGDRAGYIAQTMASISTCRQHVAFSPPFVQSSQASRLFPSESGCVSFLICIHAKYTLRCVQNQGATSPHFTKLTCNQEQHTAPLALANSLLACKDRTKVWRKLVP